MLENIEILGATVKNGGRKRRSFFFSFWDRRNRFPEPTTNGVRARCIFFPNRHVRERSERGSKLGVRECVGVYRSERDRVNSAPKWGVTDGRTKGFVLNFERQMETNNRDCSSVVLRDLENRNFHPMDWGKLIDHSGPEYVDSSFTAAECNLKKKRTVKHWEVYRARTSKSTREEHQEECPFQSSDRCNDERAEGNNQLRVKEHPPIKRPESQAAFTEEKIGELGSLAHPPRDRELIIVIANKINAGWRWRKETTYLPPSTPSSKCAVCTPMNSEKWTKPDKSSRQNRSGK